MAVKAKSCTASVQHISGKPKLTRQGNGKRSKPRGTRKLRKGQGR